MSDSSDFGFGDKGPNPGPRGQAQVGVDRKPALTPEQEAAIRQALGASPTEPSQPSDSGFQDRGSDPNPRGRAQVGVGRKPALTPEQEAAARNALGAAPAGSAPPQQANAAPQNTPSPQPMSPNFSAPLNRGPRPDVDLNRPSPAAPRQSRMTPEQEAAIRQILGVPPSLQERPTASFRVDPGDTVTPDVARRKWKDPVGAPNRDSGPVRRTRLEDHPPAAHQKAAPATHGTAHFQATRPNPLDAVKKFNADHGSPPPIPQKHHDVAARKRSAQAIADLAREEAERQKTVKEPVHPDPAHNQAQVGRKPPPLTPAQQAAAEEIVKNTPPPAPPLSPEEALRRAELGVRKDGIRRTDRLLNGTQAPSTHDELTQLKQRDAELLGRPGSAPPPPDSLRARLQAADTPDKMQALVEEVEQNRWNAARKPAAPPAAGPPAEAQVGNKPPALTPAQETAIRKAVEPTPPAGIAPAEHPQLRGSTKISGGQGVWRVTPRDPEAPPARNHRTAKPDATTPAARNPLNPHHATPQENRAALEDLQQRWDEARGSALERQRAQTLAGLERAQRMQDRLLKSGKMEITSDFADQLNQARTPEAKLKLAEQIMAERQAAEKARLLQATDPKAPHAPPVEGAKPGAHVPGVGGPRITTGAVADAAGIPTTAKGGLAALALAEITFAGTTAYNLYQGQDLKSSVVDGAKTTAAIMNPLPDTTAAIQQGRTSPAEITSEVSGDVSKLALAGAATLTATTTSGALVVGAAGYAVADTTIKAGRNFAEDPEKATRTYLGSIVNTFKENPGAGITAFPLATIDVAYGEGTTQRWRANVKDTLVAAKNSVTDAWNDLVHGKKPQASPAPTPQAHRDEPNAGDRHGIDMASLQQTSGAVPPADAKGATTLPPAPPATGDKKLTDKPTVVPPAQRDLLKPMM